MVRFLFCFCLSLEEEDEEERSIRSKDRGSEIDLVAVIAWHTYYTIVSQNKKAKATYHIFTYSHIADQEGQK